MKPASVYQRSELIDHTKPLDTEVKITTISSNNLTSAKRQTKLKLINELTKTFANPVVSVYQVDLAEINGYLPSKVWHDNNRGFVLMYYTNPHISAKPFKGCSYFFSIPSTENYTMTYDMRVGIFIDQIRVSPEEIVYFFMFGQSDIDLVLQSEKSENE